MNIVIVEDNDTTRSYLTSLVGGVSGFHVSAACRTADDALICCLQQAPDIILLDLNLPGLSGLDFISELRKHSITSEVVVLTMHEDRKHLLSAFKRGASGYILKGADSVDIVKALQEVAQGGAPMSPSVARLLVDEFKEQKELSTDTTLTGREREVLQGVAQGWQERELALNLGLSSHTIHSHIKNIYRKLQVNSKIEAINTARRRGII